MYYVCMIPSQYIKHFKYSTWRDFARYTCPGKTDLNVVCWSMLQKQGGIKANSCIVYPVPELYIVQYIYFYWLKHNRHLHSTTCTVWVMSSSKRTDNEPSLICPNFTCTGNANCGGKLFGPWWLPFKCWLPVSWSTQEHIGANSIKCPCKPTDNFPASAVSQLLDGLDTGSRLHN